MFAISKIQIFHKFYLNKINQTVTFGSLILFFQISSIIFIYKEKYLNVVNQIFYFFLKTVGNKLFL